MQSEKTSSTSTRRFSNFRSWRRGATPLVALLLMACSGSSTERGRTDTGAPQEAGAGTTASASGSTAESPSSVPSTPVTTPVTAPVTTPAPSQSAATPGPNLTYGVLDTSMDGEVPIRWIPVFNGPPRTRLEGGVLWAPAEDVVRVLSPGARVAFEGGQLKVDGKPVTARARVENGVVWSEVVPLARHFGALGRVQAADQAVVLFPRATLLWMRDKGDPNAPAVREAKEAGLLDG
jgi:hypothetical protein